MRQVARADEDTVAQADDQSAHQDANATKTANDTIAAAREGQANQDATAAHTADEQAAAAHLSTVIEEAAATATWVHAGADQAANLVATIVPAAAARVAAMVPITLGDYQSRNAAYLDAQIAQHDTDRQIFLSGLPAARDAQIAAAQQQLATDQVAPASAFVGVYIEAPQSTAQVALDYMPIATTVFLVNVALVSPFGVPGHGALIPGGAAGDRKAASIVGAPPPVTASEILK